MHKHNARGESLKINLKVEFSNSHKPIFNELEQESGPDSTKAV